MSPCCSRQVRVCDRGREGKTFSAQLGSHHVLFDGKNIDQPGYEVLRMMLAHTLCFGCGECDRRTAVRIHTLSLSEMELWSLDQGMETQLMLSKRGFWDLYLASLAQPPLLVEICW